MNPRKKRIAIAVCLFVLAGAIGTAALFVKGKPRNDAAVAAGSNAAKAGTVTVTAGPAVRRLRHLLNLETSGATTESTRTDDDGKSCGLDQLNAALNGEQQAMELIDQARTVLDGVATRMSKSSIEQERAMGLFTLMGQAESALYEKDWEKSIKCLSDDECSTKQEDARQRAIAPHVAALVQMALVTRDPAVYATTFYACRSSRSPDCKQISAGQWAAMDRNNTVAWMHLAGFSADPAQRDQAFLNGSTSALFESRMLPVMSLAQSEVVASKSLSVRVLIGNQLAGSFLRHSINDYISLSLFCKPPADKLPGRQAACAHYAKYAGQPMERIKALTDEKDALMHTLLTYPGFVDPTTCVGARNIETYVGDLSRIGEVAALRQWAAAS